MTKDQIGELIAQIETDGELRRSLWEALIGDRENLIKLVDALKELKNDGHMI